MALHATRSLAATPLQPISVRSFCMTSFQVFFGLPLAVTLSTLILMTVFTQLLPFGRKQYGTYLCNNTYLSLIFMLPSARDVLCDYVNFLYGGLLPNLSIYWKAWFIYGHLNKRSYVYFFKLIWGEMHLSQVCSKNSPMMTQCNGFCSVSEMLYL